MFAHAGYRARYPRPSLAGRYVATANCSSQGYSIAVDIGAGVNIDAIPSA